MNGNQGLTLHIPGGAWKAGRAAGQDVGKHQQELLMKLSREEEDAGLEGKSSV